jgi:hypothetical protein
MAPSGALYHHLVPPSCDQPMHRRGIGASCGRGGGCATAANSIDAGRVRPCDVRRH